MLYFIVNYTAQGGKSEIAWKKVRSFLQAKQVKFKAYRTRYSGHAAELAQKIIQLKDRDLAIVVIGGDGTFNEVVNGIYRQEKLSDVRIGLIPVGSGNDFARGVLETMDPIENLTHILENFEQGESKYRSIDIGHVDGHNPGTDGIFNISCGLGLDAEVCRLTDGSRLKKFLNRFHMGDLTYILLTVYALFSMKTESMDYLYHPNDIAFGKTLHHGNVIFLAAMNMRTEGGGVPMAPGAKPDDGLLNICCAHDIPKWVTFFCLPLLEAAKHEGIRGFESIGCESFSAHFHAPMTLHADGEVLGQVTDVQIEIMKGALHFLN